MWLHLVLPGLILPPDLLSSLISSTDLPHLSRLLGRADRRFEPASSSESLAAALFDLPSQLPWAALRQLGEGRTVEPDRVVWAADPVHLHFARDALVLTDASRLDIADAEREALLDSLERHLADLGQWLWPHARHAYLYPAQDWQACSTPLQAAIGRKIDAFLPEGEPGAPLRRCMNEVQMLWHDHAVNRVRDETGAPALNSIWLWGGGRLSDMPPPGPPRFAALATDESWVRGLGQARGAALLDEEALLGQAPRGDVLCWSSVLFEAALYRDTRTWREQLLQLDRQLIEPALRALDQGRYRGLSLTGSGDHGTLSADLPAGRGWQIWRRPQSLAAVVPTQAPC